MSDIKASSIAHTLDSPLSPISCHNKAIFLMCSPLNDGPGQQCCYGEDNVLIKKYTGGSADVESPIKSYYRHVVGDLLPYILCCKGDYNICEKYYSARPDGSERGYILPIPGNFLVLRKINDFLTTLCIAVHITGLAQKTHTHVNK